MFLRQVKCAITTTEPDFARGTDFVVLGIITLAFSGHDYALQIGASLFIMLWGARLSGFLLIPFPPQLYAPMSTIVKRTIFLEFPIYVFDPAKQADQSKLRERDAAEAVRGEGESNRQNGD